jgi:hypothetical protein
MVSPFVLELKDIIEKKSRNWLFLYLLFFFFL